ncbi:hypothetical protein Goari_024851, partial [Gossypium aridum]|nr:hypothetical protein [Gossypium aridum]
KLFELTKGPEESSTCLEQLALCFFNPLLQSQRDARAVNAQGIQNTLHFLDLFRKTEEGIDMVWSMTEVMEAGVVIEKAVNCPPLDVSSEGRYLKIPPLYINDHKGILFRTWWPMKNGIPNAKLMSHHICFFFDGLIKSAEDVGLLHHKGVLRHCLGSNKEVAKLVNGLCKEIANDGRESYLCKVVHDMNTCCNGSYAWFRAGLVHHYFRVVGISTLGATIVVYFSLIQTGFVFVEDIKNLNKPFYYDLIRCLVLPLHHLFFSKIYKEYKNKIYMYSI